MVHHFSVGGLCNGLAVLLDDETKSYWDHVTGEAALGPLQGRCLEVWSIALTTVAAALESSPELRVHRSRPRSLIAIFMRRVFSRRLLRNGFIPPPFRLTMGKVDGRLPKLAQGLGVVIDDEARFYRSEVIGDGGIVDEWDGRRLRILNGDLDGIPRAQWEDSTEPFQLLTRWYGFSFTFPDCSIWTPPYAAKVGVSQPADETN